MGVSFCFKQPLLHHLACRHVTAYACVGGQGALALVIMLQSLPSLSEVQAQRWQTLAEWMQVRFALLLM